MAVADAPASSRASLARFEPLMMVGGSYRARIGNDGRLSESLNARRWCRWTDYYAASRLALRAESGAFSELAALRLGCRASRQRARGLRPLGSNRSSGRGFDSCSNRQ